MEGPTPLQYLETRLNLLTVTIEKLEKNVDAHFVADRERQQAYIKGYDERFQHLEQMFLTGQETAKRAVDKAEAAQNAHNLASNEWRGTLNDFKSTLIGRPEFERFYSEFSAYRLESARINSMTQGEKTGTKETKETNIGTLTLIIAVVSVAASVAMSFMLRPTTPPQVVVVPTPPQTAPK